MYIFQKSKDLQQFLSQQKNNNGSVGFVPTMGALHEGHLSLIKASKTSNDITVCSIFVNPTQFGNPDDLKHYPRTEADDIEKLISAGCDVLYLPQVEDVYPNGVTLKEHYDLGYLETVLEGTFRQGHFQGVAQVVERLLRIVSPDNMYLGQKDFQQCMVLSKLVALKQLPVALHFVPTRREPDGLAQSSRNRRLTDAERAIAPVIYQCLVSVGAKKSDSDFAVVKKECWDLLVQKGFTPEYIELADATNLELLQNYDNNRKMVVLIAAQLGKVRLIDNMILD